MTLLRADFADGLHAGNQLSKTCQIRARGRGRTLSSHRPVERPGKAPGRARDRSAGKSPSRLNHGFLKPGSPHRPPRSRAA
jgi:hypothetical protein